MSSFPEGVYGLELGIYWVKVRCEMLEAVKAGICEAHGLFVWGDIYCYMKDKKTLEQVILNTKRWVQLGHLDKLEGI